MAKTIELDHLAFTHYGSNDPHEFDPKHFTHPCIKWCENQGLQVEFYRELMEVLDEEGNEHWDLVQESDPKVFAVFENDDDAVMFMLRWSEEETIN